MSPREYESRAASLGERTPGLTQARQGAHQDQQGCHSPQHVWDTAPCCGVIYHPPLRWPCRATEPHLPGVPPALGGPRAPHKLLRLREAKGWLKVILEWVRLQKLPWNLPRQVLAGPQVSPSLPALKSPGL